MCVLCITIVPTVVLKAIFDDDTRARDFLKTTVKKKYRDDDCVSFSSFWSPLLDVVLVDDEVVEIVFVDAAFPIFFFYFFFFFFSRDEDDE